MADSQGFEPRQRESKSLVLPLHHESKSGRRGGIRTPDGLLPKQVHYQAVLRAELAII